MRSKTELTNMVMIQDPGSGNVLVQERVKSWKGLAFPGGHVEDGESFYASAVREVKEETGLDVRNLKFCGMVHWLNRESGDRFLVFLYRTDEFSGELCQETEEGKNFWMPFEELKCRPSENGFSNYLRIFQGESVTEAFVNWSQEGEEKFLYL